MSTPTPPTIVTAQGPTFFGLTAGDLAKLSMNVVLIIMLFFLWQAYQQQVGQLSVYAANATLQTEQIRELSASVARIEAYYQRGEIPGQ